MIPAPYGQSPAPYGQGAASYGQGNVHSAPYG